MKMNRKTGFVLALALSVTLSLSACGKQELPASGAASSAESQAESASEKETNDTAKTTERPVAVSEEDWAAMQKEPMFGKTMDYLYNGGACVSPKYLAQELGYYKEYGIDANFKQGSSVVEAVGTGQCLWGTDHIATMLVPVTNGVNMTFVAGAHIGCKSIYVPKDSPINSVEDLKGKTIAIHDGIGNSDHNICIRLLDEYGVDPTKEVKFSNIGDNAAAVAALESGEADASIFSDYFVLAGFKDKLKNVGSITFNKEFQDEPCCVTAMNRDFIKENPVHAKYIVKAIKRAGEYARLESDKAVDLMFEKSKLTGKREDQMQFWDSLHFGLSDRFTERALREIAEDYLRLGVITKKDMSVDDVMKLAWTEVCPDKEIEGLTVGDPVKPENAEVAVKQKGE